MNKRKKYLEYLEDFLTTSFPYYAKTHGFIPKNFPFEPRINRIIGHTEQFKTEGKNLLNPLEYVFTNGIYINRTNGTIGSGAAYKATRDLIPFGGHDGQTISLSPQVAGSYPGVAFFNASGTYISGSRAYNGVIVPTNTAFIKVSFNVNDSDLQIEISASATTFEPYTGGAPAPSPQYPQPLEDFYAGENNPMRSIGNVNFDEIFRASNGYYYESRRVKKVTFTTSMGTVLWNAQHNVAYLRFPVTDQMTGITNQVAAYCPVAYPVPSDAWSSYEDRYCCYGRTTGTAAVFIDAPANMYTADNYNTFKTDMMALHPTIDFYYIPSSQGSIRISDEEGEAAISAYNHYFYDVVYYDHNYQFISSSVNNNYQDSVAAFPEGTEFYRLSMKFDNPTFELTEDMYYSTRELYRNMFVPGNILKTEPGRYSPVNGEPEENNYYIRTGAY